MDFRFEIIEALEMDEDLPENGYADIGISDEEEYLHRVGMSGESDGEWIEYKTSIYDVQKCQRDDVNALMRELFGR